MGSSEMPIQPIVEQAGIVVDVRQRHVRVNGEQLDLSCNEIRLLSCLMEEPGRPVSRDELLDRIWGVDSDVELRVADDTVKRLRKKLTRIEAPLRVETVWGFGFCLHILRPSGRPVRSAPY